MKMSLMVTALWSIQELILDRRIDGQTVPCHKTSVFFLLLFFFQNVCKKKNTMSFQINFILFNTKRNNDMCFGMAVNTDKKCKCYVHIKYVT